MRPESEAENRGQGQVTVRAKMLLVRRALRSDGHRVVQRGQNPAAKRKRRGHRALLQNADAVAENGIKLFTLR